MNSIIVYDDSITPGETIQNVIGDKGFGDVIVKRKQLSEIFRENIQKNSLKDSEWKKVDNIYDIENLCSFIEKKIRIKDELKIVHCFSNYIITDSKKVVLTFEKLPYVHQEILVQSDEKYCAIIFSCGGAYIDFLRRTIDHKSSLLALKEMHGTVLPTDGMAFVGDIFNFIQCITGNFDSRYFNSLKGTEFRIRKSSFNKKKIKSEYEYYHLIPERMKCWFVMPFDYKENDNEASYEMERLHMTDIAIKWVHGSIKETEFMELMDMYFYFFKDRSTKNIDVTEYQKISDDLYINKVQARIDDLKKMKEYKKIENLLENNEELGSIASIFEKYLELKKRVESRVLYPKISVIGHGDPCFANAMYNYSTKTLKFIDPKGALSEEELWTNPYYDIAKLSHSVCGRYDFFNNAMFDISINENFDYDLTIPFDNGIYKMIFKETVERNGYDYWSVRLYEASLFISMLPLHIDYPHKVFGFILNAIEILKEIEENV